MYYFAYGSNMDPCRMRHRVGRVPPRRLAKLFGYKLVFNKVAKGNSTKGYANIQQCSDSVVCGVLYEISKEDIAKLDRYEGFPEHYDRMNVNVETKEGETLRAITYVARPEKTKEGLQPSKAYLGHLLNASDILPRWYVEELKAVSTVD